ncbi:MAG TPA: hypothetical protein ENK15_00345 [Thermopetrobacter sp.]|nr:hypothetical protein [Thermopetrobacter sp.]
MTPALRIMPLIAAAALLSGCGASLFDTSPGIDDTPAAGRPLTMPPDTSLANDGPAARPSNNTRAADAGGSAYQPLPGETAAPAVPAQPADPSGDKLAVNVLTADEQAVLSKNGISLYHADGRPKTVRELNAELAAIPKVKRKRIANLLSNIRTNFKIGGLKIGR